MAKNTLQDLRDHLFATLEALSDDEKPMEIARAKAVCLTAQAIIDTARVEVKYIAVTGQGDEQPKKFFNTEFQAPRVRALAARHDHQPKGSAFVTPELNEEIRRVEEA